MCLAMAGLCCQNNPNHPVLEDVTTEHVWIYEDWSSIRPRGLSAQVGPQVKRSWRQRVLRGL